MPSAEEYRAAWEPENTVPYPRELWMDILPAPAAAYPSIDFMPLELVAVFDAYLDEEVELYDQINVEVEGQPTLRLMLIGAVPANTNAWFLFHADNGEIVLFDTETPTIEMVNSSFAKFLDFLYHYARFVDADTGVSGRAARAAVLEKQLMEVDPEAFADPESWWNAVIARLSQGFDEK